MKKYNVKYDIGQEVYTLENKKIIKAHIESIRVYERQPYNKGVRNNLIDMNSIEIEYLIPKEGLSIRHRPSSNWITYDWYNQENVFSEYQDKNRCACTNCGDVHITHDGKPK